MPGAMVGQDTLGTLLGLRAGALVHLGQVLHSVGCRLVAANLVHALEIVVDEFGALI